MNIFALDYCPLTAAKYHNNKHVVKQILETTQLLSTANIINGVSGPYKVTHLNHPVSKWVRETEGNYLWSLQLGLALCQEYTLRYGKKHKCEDILKNLNKIKLPSGNTQFALAMPDDCKTNDPVESYRIYYIKYKNHLASWKNREKPFWYV